MSYLSHEFTIRRIRLSGPNVTIVDITSGIPLPSHLAHIDPSANKTGSKARVGKVGSVDGRPSA